MFVEVFVEVFVGGGQAKFCGIASKATIQSAALVDLATLNDAGGASRAALECVQAIGAFRPSGGF